LSPTATPQAYLDSDDYPRAWIFGKPGEMVEVKGEKVPADGLEASGTFVAFALGQTREFGKKPVAILRIGGEERSLWLTAEALFGSFRDELADRANHRIEPGERITAKRSEEKVASPTARAPYWGFSVRFPDRPELDPEQVFDLSEKPAEKSEADNGDVPF
jgi:hypothetical protein